MSMDFFGARLQADQNDDAFRVTRLDVIGYIADHKAQGCSLEQARENICRTAEILGNPMDAKQVAEIDEIWHSWPVAE